MLVVDERLDLLGRVEGAVLLDDLVKAVIAVGDLLAQLLRILEQHPGGAVVERAADVVRLGVLLAVVVGRVGGPHLRRAVVLGGEQVGRVAHVLGQRRRLAELGLLLLLAEEVGGVVEVVEQVGGVQLVVGGGAQVLDGLAPDVVAEGQAVERLDAGVAAGHADGHQIGVELHLPRQRAVQQVDEEERPFQHLAQHPDQAVDHPADGGDDVRRAVDVRGCA